MLKLTNISKTYLVGGQITNALVDINLLFNRTGLVLIHGPSGCGKSTLLNIIGLLDKPSSGRYEINHVDITSLNEQKRSKLQRDTFGYLFQHFHLIDGFSSVDNIIVPLLSGGLDYHQAYQRALKLLQHLKLEELANQQVHTLSGGESQRVALLRAIGKNGDIILADEPTGALDSENRLMVIKTLKQLSSKKLVIVVTHDIETMMPFADRIIALNEGKIVFDQIKHQGIPLNNCSNNFVKKNSGIAFISKRLFILSRKHFIWAIIGLTFSVISSLLTIGISIGTAHIIDTQPLKAATPNIVYISQLETIPIANSPLSLLKYQTPELEDINDILHQFPRSIIDISLRGLLSYSYHLKYENNVYENIRFEPYIDNHDYRLFNEVAINETGLKLFSRNVELPIRIHYSLQMTVYTDVNDEYVSDNISLDLSLNVTKIIDDWRFQSVPVIYYSHFSFKRMLDSIFLTAASTKCGYPMSITERITSSRSDDALGNYELMVILKNEDIIPFHQSFQHQTLSINGSYGDEKRLLSSVFGAINYGLYFFVAITFISGVMTLTLSMLHFYKLHRRRMAILWAMGFSKGDLKIIIRRVGLIVGSISLLIALLLAPIIQLTINNIIFSRSKILRLIEIPYLYFLNIPGGIVLLTTITILMLVELCANLATFSLKTDHLVRELKDDD